MPWPFGGWLEESLVEKRVYCLVVAVSAGFAGECAGAVLCVIQVPGEKDQHNYGLGSARSL